MSNDPARDALMAAWQALINRDTAERDRQCDRAEKILKAQGAPDVPPDVFGGVRPIQLVRSPDGTYRPKPS